MIHGSYLEVLGAPVVEVDTKACVHLHKVMLSCCLKCQVTGGRLHEQSWPGKICGTTIRQMGDLESSLSVARFTSRPRAEATVICLPFQRLPSSRSLATVCIHMDLCSPISPHSCRTNYFLGVFFETHLPSAHLKASIMHLSWSPNFLVQINVFGRSDSSCPSPSTSPSLVWLSKNVYSGLSCAFIRCLVRTSAALLFVASPADVAAIANDGVVERWHWCWC